MIQWHRVGRDPEGGVIIPLFEAPEGLSPAATGYVWAAAQGSTLSKTKAFTVALTSLAIKGRLTIDEKGSSYTVTRRPEKAGAAKLPPGEAAAFEAAAGGGVKRIGVMEAGEGPPRFVGEDGQHIALIQLSYTHF